MLGGLGDVWLMEWEEFHDLARVGVGKSNRKAGVQKSKPEELGM